MPLFRTTVAIALAVFLSAPAWALDPGETSYQFLRIGTDARGEAMGGALTGLADELGAAAYNPAALALSVPKQCRLGYGNWVTDIQSGYLSGAFALGERGRFALSAQYVDYGHFDGYDGLGNPTPEFNASDVALAASVANRLGEQIYWGLTGKFISQSIDGESSTGLAADLGVAVQLNDQRTRIGAAVRNVGGQTSTMGDAGKFGLPTVFAAGVSHHLQGAPLTVALEGLKPIDEDFGAAFGAEAQLAPAIALRAGYNTLTGTIDTGSNKDKLAGLSFGIGLTSGRLGIDYALSLYSELGELHRFSLSTGF